MTEPQALYGVSSRTVPAVLVWSPLRVSVGLDVGPHFVNER